MSDPNEPKEIQTWELKEEPRIIPTWAWESSITFTPLSAEDLKKIFNEIGQKAYRELLKQLPIFPKEPPDDPGE